MLFRHLCAFYLILIAPKKSKSFFKYKLYQVLARPPCHARNNIFDNSHHHLQSPLFLPLLLGFTYIMRLLYYWLCVFLEQSNIGSYFSFYLESPFTFFLIKVKTRIQANDTKSGSVIDATKELIERDGIFFLNKQRISEIMYHFN